MKRPPPRPFWKRVASLLCKVIAAFVLVSCLLVVVLRWVSPPVSSFMAQRWLAARVGGEQQFNLRYQWVDLEHISPQAGLAVMAAEDQRFLEHFGFDYHAISQALKENPRRSRPRGASTITQQVAKNLFLWPGRNWLRKGLEVYFTLLIEAIWPKDRILEMYLNVAEFGPGIYGVQAASKGFFHKTPARLTAHEAALLAAVLPNPRELRVGRPSAYVKERTQWIEKQARNLGPAARRLQRR